MTKQDIAAAVGRKVKDVHVLRRKGRTLIRVHGDGQHELAVRVEALGWSPGDDRYAVKPGDGIFTGNSANPVYRGYWSAMEMARRELVRQVDAPMRVL